MLIPKFGILAAAITTLVAYLCAFSLMWYFAFKQFKFAIDWMFIVKSVAISIFMTIIIILIGPEKLLGVILSIIFGILIYGTAMFVLKGVGKKEFIFLKELLTSGSKT